MKKSNPKTELLKLKKELKEVEKEIKSYKEDVDLWEDEFMSYLDENYDEVEILGSTYGIAWALRKLDRIAYDEALSNWCDENIDDEMIMLIDAEVIERRDELKDEIMQLEIKIENLKD
jgi:hypothetical protein